MPRVICLGEVLIDQIAEDIGVPYEQVGSWKPYFGGAPANVACGLAKLGTPVSLISAVGHDEAAAYLLKQLGAAGVETSGVQVHPESTTREIYVTRDANGDRHFDRFNGDSQTIFADTLMSAENLPEHLFADAKFLILGTLGLSSPQTSRAIARALRLAEQNFVQVVVDVNWRSMFWQNPEQVTKLLPVLLKYTDFLKMTEDEAKLLFRLTSPAAIAQAYNHLEGIIITNGDKDCRYYLGEKQSKHSAFPVHTMDTTGAGDAFLAAFIHKIYHRPLINLLDSKFADEAIAYACAAGALSTLDIGAISGQPSDRQINEFLAMRGAKKLKMHSLSLPTWVIHVSSVIEWAIAIWLIWTYDKQNPNRGWGGLAWAMFPALISAMCAVTWHFFDNADSLEWLVTVQAFLTLLGNCTLAIAAYFIWKKSLKNSDA